MAQIDVNLRDIYRVVRKRKWIILFAPILMGISTYLLTEIPPPVYTSEALTKVTRSSTLAALMAEMVTYSAYDNMATQVMIIRSRPVLENVARKLNMVKPGEDTQNAFLDLRGRVNAEQRAGSDILAISGNSARPEEAIALANTVVDAYIEAYNAERDRAVKETFDLINRRYEQVTNELNDVEKELFEFKRAQAGKLNLDPTMLPDLQQRQVQYRRTVADLSAMLDTITRIKENKDYESFLQTYFVIDDPIARQMTDQVVQRTTIWVDLRNKREALLKYQTEVAPQVRALNDQMKIEEQRLVVQLNTLANRLKVVVADDERLLSTTETQQSVLAEQPSLTTTLDDLTLRVKEKQELVAGLRKQLQDAEIQQKEKAEEVTIVERAHTATSQPNRSRTYQALVGALIGILIGGIFAFVLEAMDTSLGTIEDVEQHINSVVLGIIPHLDKEDIKDRMKVDKGPSLSAEEMDRFSRLVTHFDPKAVGSEAYRTLRTNLASIMSRSGTKVLMVSSSMIQEGKSTSCCNIATAFAQSGKRTLLIDADLRRPIVDKVFGIVRAPGLTDLLLDTRDPRECIRTIDDIMLGRFGLKLAQLTPGLEYLTILPAGRIVDKPTELLSAPALDKLLEDVRSKFDVVVVDVAPILPVADAFVLAPKVDGIVLAYQIGRVARDVLKRTKMRIEGVGGKVWGVILNDIRSEINYRSDDYSYYNYRYDRQVDERSGVINRIRSFFKRGTQNRKKPDKKPPSVTPPPATTGTRSRGSRDVNDIMSLTDDEG